MCVSFGPQSLHIIIPPIPIPLDILSTHRSSVIVLQALLHPEGMACPSRVVSGAGSTMMGIFALEEPSPVKKSELDWWVHLQNPSVPCEAKHFHTVCLLEIQLNCPFSETHNLPNPRDSVQTKQVDPYSQRI